MAGALAAAEGAAAEVQVLDKMKSSGKLIGGILIGGGILILLVAVGVIFAGEGGTMAGKILGAGLAFLICGPIVAVGIYMLVRGGQEEKAMAHVTQQRKLLNIINTKGQISISDLTLELDSTFDQVKAWIYDLVGKGLFSGYVNWDEGTLYSQQASQLRDETRCKHCGGELSLAGKGVVHCPYCGTEYFLA